MNILFLSDDFPPQSFGGAGIVAYNLAKALCTVGHSVSVITTVQDKKSEGIVEYDGLKIYRIYANYPDRFRSYISLYNFQTVQKVKKIINEIKPEIVHSHNIHYFLSYHCLKIAKQSGAKVFLTAHDVMLFHYGKLVELIDSKDSSCPKKFNYKISSWQQMKVYKKRYNPLRNSVIKYYVRNVDKIFSVSSSLKDALNQNGIDNVEVIHNGIDTVAWDTNTEELEAFIEKHNLSGKKVVLFGGRLSDSKGGYQAVLAMKEVVAQVPGAVMLIMGGINTYVEQMQQVAKEWGIDQQLIFTGWIHGHELKSAYAAADIVIVPSVYLDPFPTINLEAMACKKPVVGTCFGGTQELVEDGKTGYVVNPYNTESLAGIMVRLLTDATVAQKMGEAGYRRVKENFSLDLQVKRVLLWYNELVP